MNRTSIVRTTIAAMCGAVLSSTVISAQQASAPQQVPVAGNVATPQGFSVVLVIGDLQGGTTSDNVPAAARKALADMKDFLPYKSYRLLDAAWILGSQQATLRLHGPDAQEYELNLRVYDPRDFQKVRVDFHLRDGGDYPAPVGSGDTAARATQVEVRKAQLVDLEARRRLQEETLRAAKKRYQDRHPEVVKIQGELEQIVRLMEVARAEVASSGFIRKIIDTSFNMDVGETVVVGTSRLGGGDKSLIALLTAVPRAK